MAGDGGGVFSWTSLLLGIAGTAGVTVLGGLLALFYFQRALIYPSNVPAVRRGRSSGGGTRPSRAHVLARVGGVVV
jgi:hypothetical protein